MRQVDGVIGQGGQFGAQPGPLLLALDATVVSLVDAPRGLDLPVASTALIDS
ncbi:hypothetical protein, partial [Mycobacterium tuberculosis]|uniref:hypothetical protein n=1 Tax=Mycobacterium tuberculosis TaxID=1773 RepID=UPI003F4A68DF